MGQNLRWTEAEYEAYIKRSGVAQDSGAVSAPEPEQAFQRRSVGAAKGKEGSPTRLRVHIESRRTRLIDPDNLCPKYVIDALRYAGVLDDDTAKHVTLEVEQTKVKSEQECTVITITTIPQ